MEFSKTRFSGLFHRRYLFHLFFWLMYGVFMIMEMQGYVVKRGWLFALLPFLVSFGLMAMLVYGHTLVLIPLLLEKKKRLFYGLGIIFLIVINTLLRSRCQQYFDELVWPEETMTITSYFKWNLFYAVWFILISSMLLFTQRWTEQRQQVKNIQISQLQTELKYLRAQVNPHFLFNGLNTIYGTIDQENRQAREMMVQFSDLLRYNLYEADVDWVELRKEAIYLENYVALQRARSDSNLDVELDIQLENPAAKVAPLIFVTFVENAFKYSTRDDSRTNLITIKLFQQAGVIRFTCRNFYDSQAVDPGGIGLINVSRRLELLYKDHFTLEIMQEQGLYSIELTLTA